jgi:hypothetical protein
MSYLDFRWAVLVPTDLSTYLDYAHFSCVLALASAKGREWIRPLVTWAPLGLAMLVIGMRGETLVPIVAFAVILSYRGVRLRRSVLLTAVAIALVIIPTLKATREVGLSNLAEVDLKDMTPLETFTELGGTLRAARAYVDWIAEGDSYLLGATYLVPFDRQILVRIVPGYAGPRRPLTTALRWA